MYESTDSSVGEKACFSARTRILALLLNRAGSHSGPKRIDVWILRYGWPSSRVGCRMLPCGEPSSSKSPVSVRLDSVGSEPRIKTRKDPRVERVLELLHQGHAATGNDVAKALNLSSSRLRHLFKGELGMSRRQYHKHLQLSRARELLANSFLSVKEISHRVGANDMSHFSRDYKAMYRETPSQTRMSISRIAVDANK